MDGVLVAAGGAALGGTLLAGVELRERRQQRWQSCELRFSRQTPPDAVSALLERIAGLPSSAAVAFELRADHTGVRHFVSATPAVMTTLRGALLASLPGARLKAGQPQEAATYMTGRVIRLRGRTRSLRDDNIEAASAGLLAAVQPLGRHERVVIRWLLMPGRQMTVPRAERGQAIEAEERRRLRTKNEGGVLRGHGVVAVQTGHVERARHLIGRVMSVLRSRNTAYGQLRSSGYSGRLLEWQIGRRHLLLGDRFAVNELVGLLGWPIGSPPLPGVSVGTSPLLIPSARLPRSGRLLGTATWPGAERPVAQPVIGGLSHSLVVGPTGVGKSTLITNLITADLDAGRGLVLIDGKGDTVRAVLERIPESRRDDVVVLDCADRGAQPGIRLFSSGDPGLSADVVLGVLADLFRDSWGPLSDRWLRAGLVAVAHDPDGTLADVPYVFTDAAYRRKLVGRLRDPLIKATFAAFEAMSPGERQQQLSAPLGKLGRLLGRPIVRQVLGQAEPQLDFRRALSGRQVILISLASAVVGAAASRLLGAVLVFALFQAVQARTLVSESKRRPLFVYVDEPRALGDLPMPLDALLEQARGLGVGMTLAPQSMTQLPASVRNAALTNVATRVVFRQDADDARLLARDLTGVTPEDLGDLAAFEAVARIGLGPGDVAVPVTIRTSKSARPVSDGGAVRRRSAQRYGQTLEVVDAGLDRRHRAQAKDAAVGRKRRAS